MKQNKKIMKVKLYAKSHDAAGEPKTIIVNEYVGDLFFELDRLTNKQFLSIYDKSINFDEEQQTRLKFITSELRGFGFSKWDLRTNWVQCEI